MTTRIDLAVQTPRLNLTIFRRPQLKLNVLPRYPYALTASLPIMLSVTGGAYNISFDGATGAAAIAPYITQYVLGNAPIDGFVYGSKNSAWARAVDLAGSTMTGPLILNADPAAALGAATKQMVDLKAPLASPALTGNPTAPTAAVDDNDTSIATTAFVLGQAASGTPLMDSGAGTVGVLTRYARSDHVHPTDTSRAPLASPVFTGDPKAPTPAIDDNDTSIATTAFVLGQAYGTVPNMDGVGAIGVSTRWARGDHTHPSDTSRAPLASPGLTGVPTAPTAGFGTNTTQIATTAFVLGQANSTASQIKINGVQAAGVDSAYARADHVHPTDTSRMATAGGQTITGGFNLSPAALGNSSGVNYTVNPLLGNYQYITNNGAWTLTAPASDCAVDILITNAAGAGAITFSGFTVGTTGDALTTTSGNKFIVSIRRINATATYLVKALQ